MCSLTLFALRVVLVFILHPSFVGIKPLLPLLFRVQKERLLEGRNSHIEWAAYRNYDVLVTVP